MLSQLQFFNPHDYTEGAHNATPVDHLHTPWQRRAEPIPYYGGHPEQMGFEDRKDIPNREQDWWYFH